MDYILDLILFSWFGGLTLLVVGVWQLIKVIKEPNENFDTVFQPFLNSVFFSIGLIALGVIVLYFKITGEW